MFSESFPYSFKLGTYLVTPLLEAGLEAKDSCIPVVISAHILRRSVDSSDRSISGFFFSFFSFGTVSQSSKILCHKILFNWTCVVLFFAATKFYSLASFWLYLFFFSFAFMPQFLIKKLNLQTKIV